MANARGREIDNTHLSIDQAEKRGFLHRDYIAHCLRWTKVCNYIHKGSRYKTSRILDVGCGVDVPMAKMLYSSRLIVEDYVGVDYNDPSKFNMEPFHSGKFPISVYGNVEFPKDLYIDMEEGKIVEAKDLTYSITKEGDSHLLPNIITFFEVFEHIEPAHGRSMLQAFHKLLSLTPNSLLFMSTPCYDAQTGAADNHVSEVTYEALGALIEDLGFGVQGHWGTFASQKDYKHKLMSDFKTDMPKVWEGLTEYYDSNYLATIFAPLYPQHARNCLWQLGVAGPNYQRKFKPLSEVEGPWTSSARWKELAGI